MPTVARLPVRRVWDQSSLCFASLFGGRLAIRSYIAAMSSNADCTSPLTLRVPVVAGLRRIGGASSSTGAPAAAALVSAGRMPSADGLADAGQSSSCLTSFGDSTPLARATSFTLGVKSDDEVPSRPSRPSRPSSSSHASPLLRQLNGGSTMMLKRLIRGGLARAPTARTVVWATAPRSSTTRLPRSG